MTIRNRALLLYQRERRPNKDNQTIAEIEQLSGELDDLCKEGLQSLNKAMDKPSLAIRPWQPEPRENEN